MTSSIELPFVEKRSVLVGVRAGLDRAIRFPEVVSGIAVDPGTDARTDRTGEDGRGALDQPTLLGTR
jgi:hypothetical protein